MSSGKDRIYITQMEKSQGWCLWESKALSRAAVGATTSSPLSLVTLSRQSQTNGLRLESSTQWSVNPALNGVSLFT